MDEMDVWTTAGDGVDRLRRARVPVPDPAPGQVLVRISAVALNYRDLLVIDGVDGWRPRADVVPISDGVGTVVAVGERVTRLSVGDRVAAMFLPRWHQGPLRREDYVSPVGGPVNPGMLAEYVAVDAEAAARTPTSLTDHEAATLPVAGITAWHALQRCGVGAGDTVLVHGTGGVALFALQFAVARGARVIVTSGSDVKLERARRLGAVGTVNYRTEPDVAARVVALTSGEGVDHVVETVGGENLNVSLRAVRIGGNIAFIGLIAGKSAAVNTYEFVTRNVGIHGIETGSREMYQQMAAFVDEHAVKPVVDVVLPTERIAEALEQLRAGGHFGKIVLSL